MDDADFMSSPVVQKMAATSDDTKQHKINEYLHLTASAVKINYPKVKITTDELIKRVESLSFHQYYDQMVRIMEMEKRKMEQSEHLAYINNLLSDSNSLTINQGRSAQNKPSSIKSSRSARVNGRNSKSALISNVRNKSYRVAKRMNQGRNISNKESQNGSMPT